MKYLLLAIMLCAVVISTVDSHAAQKESAVTIQDGKNVAFDYILKVDDKIIDNSEGKEPFKYVHGQKMIVPGLEKALKGMKVGEIKTVVINPEEGYGIINKKAFRDIPRSKLPPELEPKEGMILQMRDPSGGALPVRIAEVKEDVVVLDLNHPLAGKVLCFDVKILSVK